MLVGWELQKFLPKYPRPATQSNLNLRKDTQINKSLTQFACY